MTTLSLKRTLFKIVRSSSLSLTDSSCRLECNTEVNRSTVRNTTLDTARVVSLSGKAGATGATLRSNEGVIVDRAGNLAAAETRTNLEALGGGDAEHGVGELGFQLVEAGLAQPDGDVADNACYGSADAVVVVAVFLDDLGHAGCGVGVWAAGGREGVHGVAIDCLDHLEELGVRGGGGVFGGWGEEVLVSDGGDEGDDFNAVRETEVFLGDGAGGDTAWIC